MNLKVTPIYPKVDLKRTGDLLQISTLIRVLAPDDKYYLTLLVFTKIFHSKVDEDSIIKLAIADLAVNAALLKYTHNSDSHGNLMFILDPNQEPEEVRMSKIFL